MIIINKNRVVEYMVTDGSILRDVLVSAPDALGCVRAVFFAAHICGGGRVGAVFA